MSTNPSGIKRSHDLPYRMLAGVTTCRNGWLVQAGRLSGVTLYPLLPVVLPTLQDVLDLKPSFDVVAIHIPLGLPTNPGMRRRCDIEARQLLGYPRSLSIGFVPSRQSLSRNGYEELREIDRSTNPFTWNLLPKIREAAREIASYSQRVVHEVHPELSFYELNEKKPMVHSKYRALGVLERRELLQERMQNINSVMESSLKNVTKTKMLDACACLWTARRIAARGAAIRLPLDPEWDDEGMRMEIWR